MGAIIAWFVAAMILVSGQGWWMPLLIIGVTILFYVLQFKIAEWLENRTMRKFDEEIAELEKEKKRKQKKQEKKNVK